ncbi:MAG: hypothetical protein P4L57_12585 [Rhizomicrobium sp.]|nr:hypothetical protein [Rhizomicrobium sp.]
MMDGGESRSGMKIRRAKARAGSSPAARTMFVFLARLMIVPATLDSAISNILTAITSALKNGIGACIHWHYFPNTLIAVALVGIAALSIRPYRRWHTGWLSYQIDKSIRGMERKRRASNLSELLKSLRPRSAFRTLQHGIFGSIRATYQYARYDLWSHIGAFYMPSVATVAIALLLLGGVLFLPHWPAHFALVYHVLQWPEELASTFDAVSEQGFSHLFEGLIVVVIALIVFVAESVRTSRSADEKRVLLKISNLWPLAVLITILPFGFLYPPATVLSAALVILVALATVYGFARVLQNLIDPEAGLLEQRAFLRGRVQNIVIDSARQRVGNKLLFDEFGMDSDSGIRATLSKSFIPDGAKNYVIIDAPSAGILADINVERLKALGRFLQARDERGQSDIVQGAEQSDTIAGPSQTAPQARKQPERPRAYLLRRYREEVTEDTIFSNDRALLAVHKDLVKRPGVLEEVQSRVRIIFKFNLSEPSSAAFRREMQSTKDLLIAAIKASSLGEIEELRATYLLVAEQFLITLNNLGGGYTAKQAKEERRSFPSERWNEIRWIVTDVRDLLAVAAQQTSVDSVRLIAVLPILIAIRAFQAGDQLLFQEFTNFATYLYALGKDKATSPEVGTYLVRKSWEYMKELFDNYLQMSLPTDDDDD